MPEDARNRVNDGVAASGKRQVRKADHLAPRELPATKRHLREQAEKIIAGGCLRAIKAGVEIGVQCGGLRLAIAAVEDMHPPADPAVGLGLGHVEEHGQRPRLERECEALHDLVRLVGERLLDEACHDRLDSFQVGRLPGPEKQRLDELPVFRVVGRIGLDWQLPVVPQVLLRGDRHTKGRIGAERSPVLGRPPDLLVPQQHGDGLVAGRNWQDALLLPGVAERVGKFVAHPGVALVIG